MWYIGQANLLCQTHVRKEEDHITQFIFLQDFNIFRNVDLWRGKLDAIAVGWRLALGCKRIIVSNKPNFDASNMFYKIRWKDQVSLHLIFCIVEHVGAYFHTIVGEHVFHHHFFTIYHFPVAWQHDVVTNIVHEWNDGPPFTHCSNAASLKTVTTINYQGVRFVLVSNGIDHGFHGGKSSALFENRFAVFHEKFIMDHEL